MDAATLPPPKLNKTLLKLAHFSLAQQQQKRADGPAPSPAPAPAPAPAPPPGAAAPPPGGDPQQLMQMMQQMMQGGGGMPGMPGKGGGKKAEQQLLDTKLWIIQFILVKIAESMGVQLPPSVVIGAPPDPMAMQAAQTEQSQPQGAGGALQGGDPMQAGAAAAPPGGAPGGGPPPIAPMDASTGPIGKSAAFDLGRAFGPAAAILPAAPAPAAAPSLSNRVRAALGVA